MIRSPHVAAVILGVFLLPLAARAATSIATITDNGAAYADQEVTVVGTVTEQSYGYAGESVYTLQGDERRISVVSKRPPPAVGERLEVGARVGYRSPDEEFTWPPLLLESSRHPAP
jgi:hypothetical protein